MLGTLTSCLPARCAARGLPRLKGEDGNSLVEFALVLILFMTMLFGIAGFGHALFAYHFVSHAAREASRWAAVNGSTCATDSSCSAPAGISDIQNYVKNMAPMGINSSQVTTTPSWPGTGPTVCGTTINAPGCTVVVQVSYNFSFIFPLIHTGPLTLSSTSEMIIAH